MSGRSPELGKARVRRLAGKVVMACDIALVALTLEDIATDATPLAISITKGAVSVVRLAALRFSSPKRA